MPRETVRRLSQDVERLLVAGAHLAAADAGFAKSRAALDALATQIGAKAPAITQLATAAGRCATAAGTEAARELVGLATMAAQVRFAQAQPAPSPAPTALEVQAELGTPCNAKDLGELYLALVESGSGRQERVLQSIQRGDIADLRLVDTLIHAMGDAYLGDLIATQAVPRLGAAIVAPIRASLDIAKGRAIDGRRLRALVAVQRTQARDLILAALTEGNVVMREAALNAIGDHVRGEPEYEPLVLDALQKDRSGDVRRAALRALAGYGSDASLEALVGALDDERTHQHAAEGLGSSKHPRAREWMLERLAAAVAAAKMAPKTKPGAKKSPAAPGAATVVEPATMVRTLLRALSQQRDPRIADAAMELIDDYGEIAARAVIHSGDAKQLARVADLLAGTEPELFRAAAKAAVALGADEAFKRLTAAFKAKDREHDAGQARLEASSEGMLEFQEQRWYDFAVKMLAEPLPVARWAWPILASARDRRALKPLLAVVAKERSPELLAKAIETIGRIGDAASIPTILAHHANTAWQVRTAITQAILAMDTDAAVAPVRAAYVALGDSRDQWHLRYLLQQLERRFPGK